MVGSLHKIWERLGQIQQSSGRYLLGDWPDLGLGQCLPSTHTSLIFQNPPGPTFTSKSYLDGLHKWKMPVQANYSVIKRRRDLTVFLHCTTKYHPVPTYYIWFYCVATSCRGQMKGFWIILHLNLWDEQLWENLRQAPNTNLWFCAQVLEDLAEFSWSLSLPLEVLMDLYFFFCACWATR